MKVVKLNNGAEEASSLVLVTMLSLKTLIQESPIAFYELVEICRNRNHVLFGNTESILTDLSLYPVHDSIRSVVLSAVTGNGLQMMLGSPFPQEQHT